MRRRTHRRLLSLLLLRCLLLRFCPFFCFVSFRLFLLLFLFSSSPSVSFDSYLPLSFFIFSSLPSSLVLIFASSSSPSLPSSSSIFAFTHFFNLKKRIFKKEDLLILHVSSTSEKFFFYCICLKLHLKIYPKCTKKSSTKRNRMFQKAFRLKIEDSANITSLQIEHLDS